MDGSDAGSPTVSIGRRTSRMWDGDNPVASPGPSLDGLSPTQSPGGSLRRRPSFQALAMRAASRRRSSAINWDAAIAAAAASAAAAAAGAAALDDENDDDEDAADTGADANASSPSGSAISPEAPAKKLSKIGALFSKGAAEVESDPLSPQLSVASSLHKTTALGAVAELEEFGNAVDDEDLSDSSDSEGSVSQDSEARLIQERFDMGRRTTSDGAHAMSAFTSFLVHHHEADDVNDLELSPMVAHRWRWFVYTLVHLRFADCAEQQATGLHRYGHYPMATELALADDTKPGGSSSSSDSTNGSVDQGPVPGGRPTRRASLFGSVIGTYRSGIQEGHVSLVHCLGDDVADVSQALRVRKSKTMHRVQKPPLYFDDMPGHTDEPRRLAAGGKDAAGVGGLLAALHKHSTRKLEAAIAEAQAKLAAQSHNSLLSMTNDHGGSSSDVLNEGSKEGGAATSPKRSPSKRPSVVSIAVEKRDTIHIQNKKHQKRMTMMSNDMRAMMEAQHAAHMALVMEEQRQHKLKDMMDRVHETAEFHMPRPRDLFSMLRFQYDPEGLAHPANQFYTPVNLLRREAVRYDDAVQLMLRSIWRATDVDNSGAIDRAEYYEMHSKITCALLGRSVGDSTMRLFLAKEDWESDCKGFKTLNRRRLEDCYFTLADRFTSGIDVKEYTLFLNRLLGRIIKFDSETGEVGFKSEDDIFLLGDKDPLLDENKVFQFKTAEQRAAEAKAAKKAAKAMINSMKFAKTKDKGLSAAGNDAVKQLLQAGSTNKKKTDTAPLKSTSKLYTPTPAYARDTNPFYGGGDTLPSERDLARWALLWEQIDKDDDGLVTKDQVMEATRALRKVPATKLFKENPRACNDDFERYLGVEYGLPGHAKKAMFMAKVEDMTAEEEYKWSVSHGGHAAAMAMQSDVDTFEELFHALPNGHGHDSEITGKPFTNFEDFCSYLHRRRRVAEAARVQGPKPHTLLMGALNKDGLREEVQAAERGLPLRPKSAEEQTHERALRRQSLSPNGASNGLPPRRRPGSANQNAGGATSAFSGGNGVGNPGALEIGGGGEGDDEMLFELAPTTATSGGDGGGGGSKHSEDERAAAMVAAEMAARFGEGSTSSWQKHEGFGGEDSPYLESSVPQRSTEGHGLPPPENEGFSALAKSEAPQAAINEGNEDNGGADDDNEKEEPNVPPAFRAPATRLLPKYRGLYHFVPYADRQLAVRKGDILFAVPDLDGDLEEEEGWTYCMQDGNIELRGYVPDTFILYLAPDKGVGKEAKRYHIVLKKPPQERIYDVETPKLFKVPEEADKFKKAPEQLENDELEKKMPGLDEQALRDEAMRRGLDVKGGRSQVEARLKEDLRDVDFEHGEEVSYETSGGHRHRAIIVHSARSDPSILRRRSSMLDSTVESSDAPRPLPVISDEVKPLGRQPYPVGDWNLRFPGYNFDSFVVLRQRGLTMKPSRSQQRQAAMSPYVLDESHYPPHLPASSPTAPTVSIASSRGYFHNGYAPTAAPLEPKGGFPSRMMSPPLSAHQQSPVHSQELWFQGSYAYPGYTGAGNLYGRPLHHPGGGSVLSPASPSSRLLPQPLSGHQPTSSSPGGSGGPLSSAFSPIADEGAKSDRLLRDRPRPSSPSPHSHKLAFGVDPTPAAAASSSSSFGGAISSGYVPPPGRELRLPRSNTSGGFYFAVPDHTLAAASFTHTGGFSPTSSSGRTSPHHLHSSRTPGDRNNGGGFERHFGVGAAIDGAPPREAMPASFWVFGARRHDRSASSSGHPATNGGSGVAFPASPLHALKESLKVKPNNPNIVGGQYMVAAAPSSSSPEVGEHPAAAKADGANAGVGLGLVEGAAQMSLEEDGNNSSAPATPHLARDSKDNGGSAAGANASFYAHGSLEGVHVPREQSTPGQTMDRDSLVALEQARQFARDIIQRQDYSGSGMHQGVQQQQKQRPRTAGPLGRSDRHFNSNGQAHAVSLLAQVRSSLPYDPRPKEESYGFDPLLFPKRAAEWDATRKAQEMELQARAQQAGQRPSSKHKSGHRRRPASASAHLASNDNNPAARREQALAAASKARAEAAGANLKKWMNNSSSGGNRQNQPQQQQPQQQPEAPQSLHWASSGKPITRSPAGAAGGSAARAAKFLKHRKVPPVGVNGKQRAGNGGVAGRAFGQGSTARNANSGAGGVAVGRGVESYGISGALKWAQGRSEQQVARRSERIVEGLATSADFLAATQSLVEHSAGDNSGSGNAWGLPNNVALPQGSIGTVGSWGVLLRTDEPASTSNGATPDKPENPNNNKKTLVSSPTAIKKQPGAKGRPQTAPSLRAPLAMGTVQLVTDDKNGDGDGPPAQDENPLHSANAAPE